DDVNDDNFSFRLQALVDKRKSAMFIQRYRAQQAKPMTRGDTVKFMRTYIKNMSDAYYSSGRTMHGPTNLQRVLVDQGVPADASIPADTCVSAEAATTTIPVNAPLDEDEPAEELSSLRRSTRKKSVAKKRTTPPSSYIPFSTDDHDAAHRV
nr:hypothetical protein [Tanacetum cinerariifolium]